MPLVRLVFPLMAGIAAYLITGVRLPVHAFFALYAGIGSWWLFSLQNRALNYTQRWLPGLLTMLVFLVAGVHLAHVRDEAYFSDHFSRFEDVPGHLLLQVKEPVAEKANSFQVVGRVSTFVGADTAAATRGNIMLYLQKDSLAPTLRYGDLLLIENRYEAVRPPPNPHQFNYKRFLSYSHIHHSTYRRSGQWHLTGTNTGKPLKRFALSLRDRAMQVFAQHLPGGHEYAVLSALLLGYRDHLDEDLQRAFSGAGAMHILCVSGLHVGIIFMMLKTMLGFMVRLPWGHTIQTMTILLMIWLYAAVTGFAPSVLRASAMFSLVAIGQNFHRRTNIYNTLAASAMLLLVINPYMITRIGFQLSYLAVISIVALQPHLYKLITCRYILPDKAWAITTVSVAAQLGTAPLALFYFNQFPNYFILTNLAAIPLSGLIIHTGVLTLAVSSFSFVGCIAGQLLHYLLMALLGIVKAIESLPFSTTSHVCLYVPDTLLLFLLLMAGSQYLLAGKRKALLLSMAITMCLLATYAARTIRLDHQQHFVVYHVNQRSAIDFITGRNRVTMLCDSLIRQPASMDFQAGEYRLRMGVAKTAETKAISHGGCIRFAGENIHILSRTSGSHCLNGCFEAGDHTLSTASGYLIVVQNPQSDPEAFLQRVKPAQVILDASNSYWTTRRWQEACVKHGIRCWTVREQGAYVSQEEVSLPG